MSPVRVYIDLQAGDGGKGRLVYLDCLHNNPGAVVRYNGGPNAGHTIVFPDGGKISTHMVPAGYFFDDTFAIADKGTLVDPAGLLEELGEIRTAGRDRGQLVISGSSHVILPIARYVDGITDAANPSTRKSTGRGIGPTAALKYARRGIRMQDLLNPTRTVLQRMERAFEYFEHLVPEDQRKAERNKTFEVIDIARGLRSNVLSPREIREIYRHLLQGDRPILLEGAQGHYLDVDDGEYPNVTSSSCGVAGTYTGTELPHTVSREVIGIFKPYLTRAGSGAVPTYISAPDMQDALREEGGEFGVTTGLPRDMGWLDLPQIREAIATNDPVSLVLTKLDVLGTLSGIGICTGYSFNGHPVDYPYSSGMLSAVTPVMEFVQGFGDIRGTHEEDKLPDLARQFIQRMEEELDREIIFVGTGPNTDDFIARGCGKDLFRRD